MSMESHLSSLARKRAEVKAEIAEEMAHPHPDMGKIAHLKRLNLHLKEETQRSLRLLEQAA